MANWNLSVDLRAQGNSLGATLRRDAGYARDLADAARDAKSEVAALGVASRTAAGHVKALGRDAERAERNITSLGNAADSASRNINRLGNTSLAATNKLRRMANQARDAAKDLRDLAAAAAAADAAVRAGLNDIRLRAELDDQTGTGVAAVRAGLASLQAASPVRLNARFDADLTGITTTAAAVQGLRTSGDINLTARLDNQTASGIAQVQSAVAALRALSPVDIEAHLDDRTGPGIAAARTALASLQASSPVRLDINVTGDTAQIVAAATAMRDLDGDATRTSTSLSGIAPSATAAATALGRVEAAAQDVSRALRIVHAGANAAADALDELRNRAILAGGGLTLLAGAASSANGHLLTLGSSTRTLRSDMDDLDATLARLAARLPGLTGSLGTLGSSTSSSGAGMRTLMLAAIGLATALVPIAASLAPIAAGLVGVAAGVGVFGAAIAGQIKTLMDASEAQKEYDEAVREHGKASPEAAKANAEMARQFKEMPQATREAAAGLAVLKDNYTDWSDSLAGDTMPVATKSFAIFSAMFPKMTPLVEGSSKELSRFMTIAAGGVASNGFSNFMGDFSKFAEETMAKANLGLVKFAEGLDTGEIGGNLKEFMAYAREHGPLVAETLGNLTKALSNILVAASDVGVGALTIVNAIASIVAAVPPEALTAFIQLYTGIKLLTMGAAALGAATGSAAVARLGAYFAIMRAAGVAPTLRATAASMSMVAKAGVVLGVLAVAAVGIDKLAESAKGAPPDIDKLTTSLEKLSLTGQFTGELKKTFGDMDGFVAKAKEMDSQTDQLEKAKPYLALTGLGSFAEGATKKLDALVHGTKSLSATEEDFQAFDQTFADMASGGHADMAAEEFQRFAAALRASGKSTAEINALFPEYKAAVAGLAAEEEIAARSMGVFGQQAIDTQGKLEAQRASADGLRQSVVALNEAHRAGLGGMIGFEASIDAAAKAAKENAGSLKMINGELDLNSPKAQAAATALQDLGAKTDEAATAARAADKSWEHVNGIYERGEASLIKYAMSMGLTKGQAQALASEILQIPDKHETTIEMRREDAIAGLNSVIAKIEATPGSKSVTVKALTTSAMGLLETLGYKTKTLPDGRVQVTARTGAALGGLAAVKRARDALSDRTITITTHYVVTGNTARRPGSHGSQLKNADGSVTDYYAQGGIQQRGVRYFANGGSESHVAQIAPAGSWRVWAEPETGGEAYVPLAPSKRTRSRAITEETVRRLGGDPKDIQWNAQGSVTDWRYDPNTGSLYSPSDAGSAGQKTKKVKGKEVSYFDLGAVEKKLKSTSKATTAWNKDLQKIADLAGGDVANALASMGKDGVALTHKMATGSTKYLNEMAAALRNLGTTAKASLTDYTRQLTKATATDSKFAANLAALAGHGYGDLAAQLAAQGDTAAMELAAAAVGDRKKASEANTAAGKAGQALTSEQVQQLVAIIAAVRTNTTGLHDVADATGLGEDAIVATATKATAQIKSSLGSRATKFLADLARAQKGMSYANGGIRAGMYATQGGIVRFAEPQTHGEAYIPLGANKRPAATRVLRDVAARFGVGLTDVGASTRPVIVVKQSGDTHVTVPAVRTGATASDIGAQVGRSVRRVNRGGVNARA
ncbi:hypothetical protein [Streptomyces sp. NPDC060366]|uniref:hypothetical protein n=1 Tax=Streptomyces sp. NPDC060366 TaxID=3347105 RepID=UPI003646BA61